MKKLLLTSLFLLLLQGCGSVSHKISFEDNYSPEVGTVIEIGETKNATGKGFDIDIESLYANALKEDLSDNNMLWTSGYSPTIKVQTNIIDYEKGNAFKRWVLPGWGTTVVSVHCDLIDDSKTVGTIDARRTVWFGGLYSIGAWKWIYSRISGDIVEDLKSEIRTN